MTDDAANKPGPKINNEYWFQYSKTRADNALKSRDEAAAKLQTLVIWLWGIYTAAAAVGFTLAGKELPFWAKCWIAAASVALIAVYWGTVWVQIPPKPMPLAGNCVQDIIETYNEGVSTKNFRIHVTLWLSLVAALLVASSLVVASLTKEVKLQAPALATAVHTDAGKRFLSITAMVPPKTKEVQVILKPTASPQVTPMPAQPAGTASKAKKGAEVTPKPPQTQVIIPESRTATYAPTAEGLVQTSIPLEGLTTPLEVTLAWTDTSGLRTTLTRMVPEPPTAVSREAKDNPAK